MPAAWFQARQEPLRDIGIAAGQKNHAVVQYRFGDRESLVREIITYRAELLDVISRFPDHVWVFLHDFPALTGKNAEMFRLRRRAYERRVEAVFSHGIESGDFRPLDTRLAVTAWLGMHNYTYLGLRAGEHFSVRDAAKSFADIFVLGIATRGLSKKADLPPRPQPGSRSRRTP